MMNKTMIAAGNAKPWSAAGRAVSAVSSDRLRLIERRREMGLEVRIRRAPQLDSARIVDTRTGAGSWLLLGTLPVTTTVRRL